MVVSEPMDPNSKSLRQLLNSSVQDAPITPDEVRRRLKSSAGRRQSMEQARPVDASEVENGGQSDASPVESAPTISNIVKSMDIADIPAGPEIDRTREDENAPSLEDVAAQLSACTLELAQFQEQLARESVTVRALNGRLCMVVTGDGRPVSLFIDRAALHGREGRHLGTHISELLMSAREQADVRRRVLEDNLSSPSARPSIEGR